MFALHNHGRIKQDSKGEQFSIMLRMRVIRITALPMQSNCMVSDVFGLRRYTTGVYYSSNQAPDKQIITASARRRTIRTSATALDCAENKDKVLA